MHRLKKILLASCLLVLLSWVGNAVENSSAKSHDSHRNIFSQSSGHQHNKVNAKSGKFHCLLHKHKSLAPCPHKHSQKEMAHPKQCKIGPDCGGNPFKSVPVNFGHDHNPVSAANPSCLNLPGNARAVCSFQVTYENPPLNAKKHPPKSL